MSKPGWSVGVLVALLIVVPGCNKGGICHGAGVQVTEPRAAFAALDGYPPGAVACGRDNTELYPIVYLETTKVDDAERTLDGFATEKGYAKLQLTSADRATFEAKRAGRVASRVVYKRATSLFRATLWLEDWGAVVFDAHAVDCTNATSHDDRDACDQYGK